MPLPVRGQAARGLQAAQRRLASSALDLDLSGHSSGRGSRAGHAGTGCWPGAGDRAAARTRVWRVVFVHVCVCQRGTSLCRVGGPPQRATCTHVRTRLSLSTPAAVGDYGFDPLRLGATNPETLKWFREAELTNGRWAMAAVVGILFTDLVGLPKFWLAGGEVRGMSRGKGAWPRQGCALCARRCRAPTSGGRGGSYINTHVLRQQQHAPQAPNSMLDHGHTAPPPSAANPASWAHVQARHTALFRRQAHEGGHACEHCLVQHSNCNLSWRTTCVPYLRPGLQKYAIDSVPLAIIEAVVFAVLEGKRYEIYKKTGEVNTTGACWHALQVSTAL